LTNTGTMLDKMKVTIRMNFNDKNSNTWLLKIFLI
jgi:hypothetical protein